MGPFLTFGELLLNDLRVRKEKYLKVNGFVVMIIQ
jgi:hypothetical protein